MSDTTLAPCSAETCGENFPICGRLSTYKRRKCRCEVCVTANREYSRKIYRKHKDKVLARQREYYAENKETVRERHRNWYERNKDEHNARVIANRTKDAEKYTEYRRSHYRANKELALEQARQWRANNPELVRAYCQARRARLMDAYVEAVDPAVVFERDGYTCQRCGQQLSPESQYPSRNYPTVDHIVPLTRGGEHSYANVQTMCMGCNSEKGNRE